MPPRTYLDHAAATPILPEARAAMAAAWERWANPSSQHREGRAARAALEDARARIKAALGWGHALIFTGGASEAALIAGARARVPGRARGATEHDALVRALPGATVLPADTLGRVDVAADGPALAAIQTVNSETGVVQPDWPGIAARVGAAGGLWLADCSQSAGRLPLPPADLIILSAHKLGGPPGCGALLVRDLARLSPDGGQEGGYRGGTEDLPAALGFAAAVEAARPRDQLAPLRARLDAAVRDLGGEVVADGAERVAEIGSYRLPGLAAAAQLIELDLAGVAVSAGSACSSGSPRPSATLAAMGWPEAAAREVIRVSFAPATTADDLDRFLAVYRRLAARARARA